MDIRVVRGARQFPFSVAEESTRFKFWNSLRDRDYNGLIHVLEKTDGFLNDPLILADLGAGFFDFLDDPILASIFFVHGFVPRHYERREENRLLWLIRKYHGGKIDVRKDFHKVASTLAHLSAHTGNSSCALTVSQFENRIRTGILSMNRTALDGGFHLPNDVVLLIMERTLLASIRTIFHEVVEPRRKKHDEKT